MRHDTLQAAHVPDPERFDPSRWLPGANGQPQQSAGAAKRVSMPFGAGPRICPGRYLALLEMKMAMAVLLLHFDITAVDTDHGGAPAEVLSFTLMPRGLRMRLAPRAPVAA
jgi:cytochrome P450